MASLDQPPKRQDALAATLSREERLKVSRFHVQRDRERAMVARGLLRQILAGYLQCAPCALAFEYNPNGKPSLASNKSGMQFNLSHSDALLLCAVSRCEVGVDLERVGGLPEMDADAIVERFFTEAEKSSYRATSGGRKDLAFYKLWTGKEAIAKCRGHGIAQEGPAENFEGTMLELTPAAGYIGSLAVQSASCRLQTWHWPDALE
jgi:4'-phosphopantetheinyl transferase